MAGSVRLGESDLTRMRAARRTARGLRVMRQTRPVFGELTVRENLRLGSAIDPTAAAGLFPFLNGRGRQQAGTLSGGEQKMLALARLALSGGTVWVLDEPTEGLQPGNVDQCGAIVREAAGRGVAVLLVEQNLDLALATADRWLVLDRGRVVEAGDVDPTTRDRVLQLLAV
jgi:branched-chain amino acid transport system ATP-binding protein